MEEGSGFGADRWLCLLSLPAQLHTFTFPNKALDSDLLIM